MKENILRILFYLFISAIFITEGWGLPFGRMIGLHLILAAPFILFIVYKLNKGTISIPLFPVIFFLLFILSTTVSTFYALDIQLAFEQQLYYISVLLWVLIAYNTADSIKRYLLPFIFIATAGSVIYSIFLHYVPHAYWLNYFPRHGYQFVQKYVGYLDHHPIGVLFLLVVSILYVLLLYKSVNKPFLTFLVVFIGLILTQLRAAYVSLAGGMLLASYLRFISFSKIITKKYIVAFFILMSIMVSATIISTVYKSLNNTNTIADTTTSFYKNTLNMRDIYYLQSIEAIRDRPFIGVGSYGYYAASMLYADSLIHLIGSSHNMFLDIATENGIISLIFFIGIIVSFVINKKIFHEKNYIDISLYVCFIVLLIFFQFQYYFRSYFLFLFFFILAGLAYKNKSVFVDKYVVIGIATILFVVNLFIFSAKILQLNKHSELAVKVYPIYKEPYMYMIYNAQQEHNYEKMEDMISAWAKWYPKDVFSLHYIGDMYASQKDYYKAKEYYLRALQYFPYESGILIKVHDMLIKTDGKDYADTFVLNYVKEKNLIRNNSVDEDNMYFQQWCGEKKLDCISQ